MTSNRTTEESGVACALAHLSTQRCLGCSAPAVAPPGGAATLPGTRLLAFPEPGARGSAVTIGVGKWKR